jgi:hypothetical protein
MLILKDGQLCKAYGERKWLMVALKQSSSDDELRHFNQFLL